MQTVVDEILDARGSVPAERSVLAAVSGIDAAGKGYFTGRLVGALRDKGVRAVAIASVANSSSAALTRYTVDGPRM